jgi:hypothetical protein
LLFGGCSQNTREEKQKQKSVGASDAQYSINYGGHFTLCLMISEKTMENSSTISECHPGHLTNYTNYTASQKIIFTRWIPTCEDAFQHAFFVAADPDGTDFLFSSSLENNS